MGVPSYLLRQPRYHVVALSLVLIALIGVIEYSFRCPINLAPIYMVPVAISAISQGFRGGLMASLVTVMTWFIIDAVHDNGLQSVGQVSYLNAAIGLISFLFVTHLLHHVKIAFNQQWNEARTDRLTGLLNRHVFLEEASRKIGQARLAGRPLTAVAVSINDFARHAEKMGTGACDEILQQLGVALDRILRKDDLIGRVGEHVFMVILPEIGEENAPLVLERLERHVHGALRRTERKMTYAIGAGVYVELPKNIEELQDSTLEVMNRATGKQSRLIKTIFQPEAEQNRSLGTLSESPVSADNADF